MSKLMKNPSIGSRVVPCGQTDGRTDMTKLLVAFINFVKASKNKEEKSDPPLPDMEP